MATFDETARQACKVDGPGLTQWLDRFAAESLGADFASWDTGQLAARFGGLGSA